MGDGLDAMARVRASCTCWWCWCYYEVLRSAHALLWVLTGHAANRPMLAHLFSQQRKGRPPPNPGKMTALLNLEVDVMFVNHRPVSRKYLHQHIAY